MECQRSLCCCAVSPLGLTMPEATQGPRVLLRQGPDTWVSGGEAVRPQHPLSLRLSISLRRSWEPPRQSWPLPLASPVCWGWLAGWDAPLACSPHPCFHWQAWPPSRGGALAWKAQLFWPLCPCLGFSCRPDVPSFPYISSVQLHGDRPSFPRPALCFAAVEASVSLSFPHLKGRGGPPLRSGSSMEMPCC